MQWLADDVWGVVMASLSAERGLTEEKLLELMEYAIFTPTEAAAAGLIDEVLAEAGEDWCALAREIRKKKFGPSQPVEFRDRARQMRFLQYRGFEPDQIQAAVSSFED